MLLCKFWPARGVGAPQLKRGPLDSATIISDGDASTITTLGCAPGESSPIRLLDFLQLLAQRRYTIVGLEVLAQVDPDVAGLLIDEREAVNVAPPHPSH